jgi:hypothetical protein
MLRDKLGFWSFTKYNLNRGFNFRKDIDCFIHRFLEEPQATQSTLQMAGCSKWFSISLLS